MASTTVSLLSCLPPPCLMSLRRRARRCFFRCLVAHSLLSQYRSVSCGRACRLRACYRRTASSETVIPVLLLRPYRPTATTTVAPSPRLPPLRLPLCISDRASRCRRPHSPSHPLQPPAPTHGTAATLSRAIRTTRSEPDGGSDQDHNNNATNHQRIMGSATRPPAPP